MLSIAFIMAFVVAAVSMILGIFIYSEVSTGIDQSFGDDIEITNETDGVWSWKEHKNSGFPMGVVAQIEVANPNRAQIESVLSGTGNGLGAMYFFKTFPTELIEGKTINITYEVRHTFGASNTPSAVEVLDGAYDKASLVDFPSGSARILKGIGSIESISHTETNCGSLCPHFDTLTPDVSGAGDFVTIFVSFHDPQQDTGIEGSIEQIEIVGQESITFDSSQSLSAVGGSGQLEYGTFTAIPVDTNSSDNTFVSQTPEAFTQADSIAFTILAIIPITLFFALFTILSPRIEGDAF